MRHRVKVKKLGREASHRKSMLKGLVNDLFKYEQITTTIPRAKETRRFAERLITYAKKGDLHHRRLAFNFSRDKKVVHKLFEEIGPRYAERAGGYTRIIKIGKFRKGDNSELSILELVDRSVEAKPSKAKPVVKEEVKPEVETKATEPEPTEE